MAHVDCGSVGQDACERSLALAEVVRSSLRKIGLAPIPRNYEIWYAYGLNDNRALSRDIEALLAGGGTPAEADLELLYDAHFGTSRMLRRVETVGSGLNAQLSDIVSYLAVARDATSAYGDALDLASRRLVSTDDARAVLAVVRVVAAATLEARQHSQRLKSRLEEAKQEIGELQQDLRTIRIESRLDPLTNLGNRKHFDEFINEAMRGVAERGGPLSLLMIDVDHFKSFNDTYGHATGDQVLRLVAASLKQRTKAQDAVARYGGEEFAVVLPNTALEDAIAVANQLRRSVMSRELKKKSTGEVIGRITVSVGVAVLLPCDTRESFIERADRHLYAAKRAGRNRVMGSEQLQKSGRWSGGA
ncbi:MAG: GGDEF domain-containing protein [Bradyrhizobium sp.]|nr:GGDEF domain-containing protein [Bradyrhizobium sp.]